MSQPDHVRVDGHIRSGRAIDIRLPTHLAGQTACAMVWRASQLDGLREQGANEGRLRISPGKDVEQALVGEAHPIVQVDTPGMAGIALVDLGAVSFDITPRLQEGLHEH